MRTDEQLTAAYVLVRTAHVQTAMQRLSGIENVRIAHALDGADNIICYIEATDYADFRQVLDGEIRKLIDDGIAEHTETMMILSERGTGYTGKEGTHAASAAWLFCDISRAKPDYIANRMKMMLGVVNAHPVIGRYDIVAYAEAPTPAALTRVIDGDLAAIKEIVRKEVRMVSAAQLLATCH